MSLTKLILAALLVPASSFACGINALTADAYQGNEKALREIDRKPLVCEVDGAPVDALVQTWALYRCIGSPVRAELKLGSETSELTNVRRDGARYLLVIGDSQVSCALK